MSIDLDIFAIEVFFQVQSDILHEFFYQVDKVDDNSIESEKNCLFFFNL